MAFATISTVHSNLIISKPVPLTPLNTELIGNGMFNSLAVAINTSISSFTSADIAPWSCPSSNISQTWGGVNIANSPSLGGTGWTPTSMMYHSLLTDGLATGYYLVFQHYKHTGIITCSQTISNMSAGTYTFSMWATPRKTYYQNYETIYVKIGGTTITLSNITNPSKTPVLSPVTFISGSVDTPWINLIGTYTLSAKSSNILTINVQSTGSGDTVLFISTISLMRTA